LRYAPFPRRRKQPERYKPKPHYFCAAFVSSAVRKAIKKPVGRKGLVTILQKQNRCSPMQPGLKGREAFFAHSAKNGAKRNPVKPGFLRHCRKKCAMHGKK
jgi:hypothetical protein